MLVSWTVGGIMPVTVIDGKPVGTGAPGPLTGSYATVTGPAAGPPSTPRQVRYSEQGLNQDNRPGGCHAERDQRL